MEISAAREGLHVFLLCTHQRNGKSQIRGKPTAYGLRGEDKCRMTRCGMPAHCTAHVSLLDTADSVNQLPFRKYKVVQKSAYFLYALTSSNISRFSPFFRCRNQEKICTGNHNVTKEQWRIQGGGGGCPLLTGCILKQG